MDCSRWNEWDGLWTEGNKNETWSMKCGLMEMRWNMSNEFDNITSPSLSLTTLQAGQKEMLHTFFFFFVSLIDKKLTQFVCL